MTAARFGGITRNGITFVEFEDGDTWCALGHVDPKAMALALNEWQVTGLDLPAKDGDFHHEQVEHLWAIETTPPLVEGQIASDADWYLKWADVTKDTPGSFAITLVSV